MSAASTPSVVARAVQSISFALPAVAPALTGAPPRFLADDEAEVCGVGIVKRADLERPDFVAQHFPDPKEKGDQWVANLRSSSDEAVRAAGHYLAATLSWESASPALRERIEACGSNGDCIVQQLQTAMFGGSNATREIDALVGEAVTTTDPFLYATAVQACHAWDTKSKRGGRCQLITLDRWTQLDGDNFVPWVFRAAAAQAQGDMAGRGEALYRASIASTSHIAGQELLGRTLASMPNDLSELERLRLHIGATGVASAWVFPSFQTITGYCTADAIRDANVHQVCEGLTSVLADRSNTLMERAIGIRMAERLGWPEERVAARKRDRDAFYQVASSAAPTDALDCASLRKQNDDFSRRSRLGELAFSRALIAESKQTVDALAKQFAGAMATFARAVAASAAAASAASAADTGAR